MSQELRRNKFVKPDAYLLDPALGSAEAMAAAMTAGTAWGALPLPPLPPLGGDAGQSLGGLPPLLLPMPAVGGEPLPPQQPAPAALAAAVAAAQAGAGSSGEPSRGGRGACSRGRAGGEACCRLLGAKLVARPAAWVFATSPEPRLAVCCRPAAAADELCATGGVPAIPLPGFEPPRPSAPFAGVKRNHSGREGGEVAASVQRMLQDATRGMGPHPGGAPASFEAPPSDRSQQLLGSGRGQQETDLARIFVSSLRGPVGC